MNTSSSEDLFNRLIVINEEAFSAGLFDVAYHALSGALHSADNLKSDQPLLTVAKIATDQLDWIDEHHPEYQHSTRSALNRHQSQSIFLSLSRQASTKVNFRERNRGETYRPLL